jgi:pimeloyl-ACP methyl ester carboxylesterase
MTTVIEPGYGPGMTHRTTPNRFVDAGGVTYAYRRFGTETGTPLLFLQHLRGSMDYWDPAVTDGLAAGRPVILFDNEGVGLSSGSTPDTFDALADNAAAFVAALGIDRLDVLGFSIGGHTAQALVLRHPALVRRLVIAGSKPRAGESAGTAADVLDVAGRHEVSTLDDFLYLFFAPTPTSQAAGRAFWERRHSRTAEPDRPTTRQTFEAQVAAIREWGRPHGDPLAELATITAPTLVVNGSNDIMAPTVNSWLMAQHIPDAQLVIYPDAGHGSPFQYPQTFVGHVAEFLDRPRPGEGES